MSARRVVAWSLAATALGCGGGDSGTAPEPGPALRVIARPQARDTVQATSLQALVVEFRTPEGRLDPGIVVRFEVAAPRDSTRSNERGVVVCRLDESPSCFAPLYPGTSFAADTTDARGRAKVVLRFGTVSGAAWTVITVPEYGIRDSVRFDVDPGSPARIQITNRDTLVVVGRQLTLLAAVVDRFGNARSDPLVYHWDASRVSVDATGKVSATAPGRTQVLISAGAAQDTAFLSVVPTGRFMGVAIDGPNTGNVVAMDFDGANQRLIARNATLPRVSVDGRVIVHVGIETSTYRMHFVEGDGSLRRVTDPTTPLAGESYGQLAADGWVYFSGRYDNGNFAIWRVRPDGTSEERLTNGFAEWRSWPSPDGKKIVYSRYVSGWDIAVMDVATRQTTSLRAVGLGAAWSPNGQYVAFPQEHGGNIKVANADGTGGVQTVPNTESEFGDTVDWTADSQFLIARSGCCVELVRAVDGTRMPLKFSSWLVQPVRAP